MKSWCQKMTISPPLPPFAGQQAVTNPWTHKAVSHIVFWSLVKQQIV